MKSFLWCFLLSVFGLTLLTLAYLAAILWFVSGISGGAADY